MKIFKALIDVAPVKIFVSLLLGTAGGIFYTFLIPILVNSFDSPSPHLESQSDTILFFGIEVSNFRFAALFLVACLLIFAVRTFSQVLLSRVAIDAMSKLRIKYYKAILHSPLQKMEQVGSSRLIASFTTDIKTIIQGAMALPDLLISAVTLIGMMLFLLYLNTNIFIFICGAVGFGVVSYLLPIIFASIFLKKARNKVDQLQEAIRSSIYGVKELKLCAAKREGFYGEVLFQLEDEVRRVNKTGITIIRSASNYGDMIAFFIIGIVAFVLINYHSISSSELTSSVMILLYITGPISIVMNAVPEIVNANISLVKAEELFSELVAENINETRQTIPPWHSIKLHEVVYQYPPVVDDEDSRFSIGPVSCQINRGEVTFIVGGNGSGKSTLSKIIASFYHLDEGTIALGNMPISESNLADYRDLISAIYTDYHLFDKLFGKMANVEPAVISDYLKKLHLGQKVTLDQGAFSTLSLSDGQRKRLALLVAFLEDKDIYIFDEWAADQDPEFKKVFYYEILPQLKERNKVIIVVSHDDIYFDVADQLITMESGKVKSIEMRSKSNGTDKDIETLDQAEPVVMQRIRTNTEVIK